jgi:Na+/serine symporter
LERKEMAEPQQNMSNHGRIVPMYHVGVFIPVLINLAWSLHRLGSGLTGDAVVQVLVAIALVLLFISVRTQILTVQDRVIRLEMRLRLARALPPHQQAAIAQLTRQQLVALRFASDAELPALVERVIAGQLPTQKAIKAEVKDWQADFLRA